MALAKRRTSIPIEATEFKIFILVNPIYIICPQLHVSGDFGGFLCPRIVPEVLTDMACSKIMVNKYAIESINKL